MPQDNPDNPTSFITPEGTFAENWREALPEDIRQEPSLADFKDFSSLAKSYVSTKKMIGADTVKLPAAEATDEEKQAFYARLGRPDRPEEYGIKAPDEMPEGMIFDEQLVGKITAKAHSLGLTREQLAGLYGEFVGHQSELIQSVNQATEKQYQEVSGQLKKEYGDKYDSFIESANKAMIAAGAKEWVDKNGLGNDPNVVKMFGFFGQKMSEDTLKGAAAETPPADAQAQLSKIMADPKHPYFDNEHPEHSSALKQVEKLTKALYGDEKIA